MPSTAPAPGTLPSSEVAAPERTSPSIAAPLASSIDWSTSSLSPATKRSAKESTSPSPLLS
jgi:hypothetical protein